jgi:2-haloacid dehalogenase
MLAAAVAAAGLGADLDCVLSVDSIRMYKPRREVYALVPPAMQVEPGNVVFVSSNRWDVMGAASFGFRAAWINRADLPDEYADRPPALVLRDLTTLLTIINP